MNKEEELKGNEGKEKMRNKMETGNNYCERKKKKT